MKTALIDSGYENKMDLIHIYFLKIDADWRFARVSHPLQPRVIATLVDEGKLRFHVLSKLYSKETKMALIVHYMKLFYVLVDSGASIKGTLGTRRSVPLLEVPL